MSGEKEPLAPADDLDAPLDLKDRGDEITPPPSKEEPAKEEPAKEEPTKEEPAKEEPAKEEPAKEEPAKEEPAKEEPAKEDGKAKLFMVPKSRYDSAKTRLETALARNQELEQKLAQRDAAAPAGEDKKATAAVDKIEERLNQIDDEFAKAIADNDQKKAAELRREERRLQNERTELVLEHRAAQVSETTIERIRYTETVNSIEEQYPQFNPDSKEYDDDLAKETMEVAKALTNSGYSASQALMRAVTYTMGSAELVRQLDGKKPASETKLDPKKTDVAKNLDTAKKQPPDMTKSGLDSDKNGLKELPDPDKMSDEDLAALPESTKRRLRGDLM